jgi:integrase
MKTTYKDSFFRALKPKEKKYRVSDGAGLYLEVRPSGLKFWRLAFRFNGKQELMTLGEYPSPVSLLDARRRTLEARALLADGKNPKTVRDTSEADRATTLRLVGEQWFAMKRETLSEKYAKQVDERLKRDLYQALGDRPIKSLEAKDFYAPLEAIADRQAFETLRRVKIYCNQILQFAFEKGLIEHQIHLEFKNVFPKPKKRHFAAVTEIERVGGLLRVLDGYQGTFPVCCALRMLPYVFVRTGELRHAKWADIDHEKAEWRYTATKTGQQQIVPLARQVVEILRNLKPYTGDNVGGWVFPNGGTDKAKAMSDNALLAAMRYSGIDKSVMTSHGFRAMARTLLDEEFEERPEYIEQQLAHRVKDTNGEAYNRTKFLEQRRGMMQRWADALDDLKAGYTPTAVKAKYRAAKAQSLGADLETVKQKLHLVA